VLRSRTIGTPGANWIQANAACSSGQAGSAAARWWLTAPSRRSGRTARATQNGFGDVTPAHSALLRDVGDDGARPRELAAHAGVTRQAVTKLVDELERLDLVRRDPDPDDGRGVIVRYTDRGRAGVAIARKRQLALERDYAAKVGADRWAEVRSTLETLFGDDPHDDPGSGGDRGGRAACGTGADSVAFR